MILETHTQGEFTAHVMTCDSSDMESPREYESSTFFGFHGRYVSPDPAPTKDPESSMRIAQGQGNICLPVYLYSHSGNVYKAAESNPFHCPWDSGLFGFIYITRADARAMYGVKRLTEANRLRVLEDLKAQVDCYSKWASGEVYRWDVEDADGETIDSCGGYYDQDFAEAEALEALKGAAK